MLESLFPCRVVVAQAKPALVDDFLYPSEREYVAHAVTKRQAEFGTARVCARLALAELNVGPRPLVPHRDRSPHWPDGVVGTISHTDGYCVVAVALTSEARGLGLDVECSTPLPCDLERLICTERERRWLDGWAGEGRGRMGKLIFSAKEAFYKAQYPTTRSFLDFREVELDFDLSAGAFTIAQVHRTAPAWQAMAQARGRLLRTSNWIVTAATLQA